MYSMHLVLYQQDMNMYRYERHMGDTEKKTNNEADGYCKLLYNQRIKNETIVSVIKWLFGEHITSRLVKTQNRELTFRCIAYNIHRLTHLIIIFDSFYWAVSIILFHSTFFLPPVCSSFLLFIWLLSAFNLLHSCC